MNTMTSKTRGSEDATAPVRRGRGRPRDSARRLAILDAATDLAFAEQGITTIEAIAKRAGVNRTTVHKWWPSAAAVALDGLLERYHDGIEPEESDSIEDALRNHLHQLVRLLDGTPAGPLLRRITAAASTDESIARALREQWVAPRRAGALRILSRAQERGEIARNVDVEAVVDMTFGSAYYRLIYGHAPLDAAFEKGVMNFVLLGLASHSSDRSVKEPLRQRILTALDAVQSEVPSAGLLRVELNSASDPAALLRCYVEDVRRFERRLIDDPHAARESGEAELSRAKLTLLTNLETNP